MESILKSIVVIGISILILDFVWLKFVFGKYFINMLEGVQKEKLIVKPIGVFVAYTILILVAYFTISKSSNIIEAFIFGFLIYAVYDSTNYATFSNYKANIAFIDSLWGGTLFAITYFIYKKLIV